MDNRPLHTPSALLGFVLLLCITSVSAAHGNTSVSSTCTGVTLQVLGSGGPELDGGRTSSAYLIWQHGKAKILVDAGSGSSVQFGASEAKFTDLEAILLSHLHTDHAADLPAFIKGGFFTSRQQNLPVLGPAGNRVMPSTNEYINTLFGHQGAFKYLSSYTQPGMDDYTIIPITVSGTTLESPFTHQVNDEITVEAMSVHHGAIPSLAWKVRVGHCEIVFSGDTNDKAGHLAQFAQNADLLVLHNAINEEAGNIAKNLHMTPAQIIRIASRAQVKKILLSHIMKRSEAGLPLLVKKISQQTKAQIIIAQDLMVLPLDSD